MNAVTADGNLIESLALYPPAANSHAYVLTGTPERLEMRVIHRKQTVATPSNRYTSRPALCCISPGSLGGRSLGSVITMRRSTRFRSRWFTLTKEAFTHLPRALARGAMRERHSPITNHRSRIAPTRDSQTSRNAPNLLKTNDRAPVYPRRFSTRPARFSGAECFAEAGALRYNPQASPGNRCS
jgi:hypothetical protein